MIQICEGEGVQLLKEVVSKDHVQMLIKYRLSQDVDKLKLQQPSLELEELGNKALASGQHEGAAIYFMLARDRTSSIGEARRLFRKGIETYMAASLFKEAMRAASGPLGDLESDLPTLRFLARTAIAAGDPARAASFARRLVFMASEADAKP